MTVVLGIIVGAPIGWLAHKYWSKITNVFSPGQKEKE